MQADYRIRTLADQHSDLKSAFAQLKVELDKRLASEQKEWQARWIKEKTNWDLIERNVRARIKINEMLNATNEKVVSQILHWLHTLHDTCSTVMSLVEQDEQDRRAMQLVGYGDQPKPTVSLDKNCMSCLGGQANQMEKHRVIQAFKLACLNYNPSKITKDGEEIERAEGIARALEGLGESSRIRGQILNIKEKYAEEVKPEFNKLIIEKDQNQESEGSTP